MVDIIAYSRETNLGGGNLGILRRCDRGRSFSVLSTGSSIRSFAFDKYTSSN